MGNVSGGGFKILMDLVVSTKPALSFRELPFTFRRAIPAIASSMRPLAWNSCAPSSSAASSASRPPLGRAVAFLEGASDALAVDADGLDHGMTSRRDASRSSATERA